MFVFLCFSDYRGRYLFNDKEEKEIKNNGYYNDNKLKYVLSLSRKQRLNKFLTNQNNLEESADDFRMRKDYEDLQTFSLIDGTTLVADNSNAEVSGLEADFAFSITKGLKLTGTYASLDGEFIDGANAGNETPRSPGESWSLSPSWSVQMPNNGWLDFSVNLSYTDEYYIGIANEPRGLQDDVTLLDASVKYSPSDDQWDLTLWGKNLTDELYTEHSINGNLGGASEIYAPPRTFGLTFNYYWH